MTHYQSGMKTDEEIRRDEAVARALREIDRARISGVSAVPSLQELFDHGSAAGYNEAIHDVSKAVQVMNGQGADLWTS